MHQCVVVDGFKAANINLYFSAAVIKKTFAENNPGFINHGKHYWCFDRKTLLDDKAKAQKLISVKCTKQLISTQIC